MGWIVCFDEEVCYVSTAVWEVVAVGLEVHGVATELERRSGVEGTCRDISGIGSFFVYLDSRSWRIGVAK